MIIGFLLQAAALGGGRLALVEPVLVLELPFTLAMASVTFHRRLHRREWLAAAAMTAGLAMLVASLAPRGGNALRVATVIWLLAGGITIAIVSVLVVAGFRSEGSRKASLLGIATGVSFGLTAALMTAMSEAIGRGFTTIFVTWQTYAMVVTGCGAMFLLQNALQAGTLVAVQPGLTLSDPLVSIAWGIAVFHEATATGAILVVTAAGALLIAWGTFSLSRSPLIQGQGR